MKKPSLEELQQLEQEESLKNELRDTASRLHRQLDREKARKEEMVQAVYRAAKDAAIGLRLPLVPRPAKQASKKVEEKALISIADMQLGKVTPTYSTEVAERRLELYADKVLRLTDIQRQAHPVREARIYLLGDIIEGELIFPHQAHQIDSSLFSQIVVDGPRIVGNFIRRMLANFDRVHVVGVIGNHGRFGPGRRDSHNPETNGDRMLYHIVQQLLANETRLTWNLPYMKNERAWYAVDYPFPNNGFLLFHGDQIPGSMNHSVGTVAKHIFGWASGAVEEPFNYVIYGHWHNSRRFRFNRFKAWNVGSTESTNTYAQEKLAAGGGPPEQLLLFCHPEVGVTADYEINLGR